MDKQYKSSSGINSSTASHGPIYEDIVSFNQSCMASDTQELGDVIEALPPAAIDEKINKGSQSRMDGDQDLLSVPLGGFIDGGGVNTI